MAAWPETGLAKVTGGGSWAGRELWATPWHRHSSQLKAWHKSRCDLYWVFPPAAHIRSVKRQRQKMFKIVARRNTKTVERKTLHQLSGPGRTTAEQRRTGRTTKRKGNNEASNQPSSAKRHSLAFHAHARRFILQCLYPLHITKPEFMWEAVEGVFDLTKYLFLISINSSFNLVVFACPFVCMNANISVTIRARTTKFGDNMWFFCTQKKTN